jgi:sRNA-binding carbon storage regulator CsrA
MSSYIVVRVCLTVIEIVSTDCSGNDTQIGIDAPQYISSILRKSLTVDVEENGQGVSCK